MIRYKVKKLWVFLKLEKIRNILDFKTRPHELNEVESYLVGLWKAKLVNRNTFLYFRNIEMSNTYEVYDRENDTLILLKENNITSDIQFFGRKDDKLVKFNIELPSTISDRLISSFNTEIEKRVSSFIQEFNDKMLVSIKEITEESKEDK